MLLTKLQPTIMIMVACTWKCEFWHYRIILVVASYVVIIVYFMAAWSFIVIFDGRIDYEIPRVFFF